MDQPITALAWVILSFSVRRRCWARTLSATVTAGNLVRRAGVLDGEMLSPLPKRAGMTKKYLDELNTLLESETRLTHSLMAREEKFHVSQMKNSLSLCFSRK